MWKIIRDHLSLSDMIFFALILLLVALSAQELVHKQTAKKAYVYKNNLLLGEYPLATAGLISIDEHNTLEIKDGKVRMSDADCPDKRCIKQGYSDMLPVICLPNKVVVEIRAKKDERVHIVR